ncbi:hypothetical protein JI56_02405 [SAR11 cluster bacterium PRT-SC02]|nr:hypothetical protein JI56_02405 [SAR11 cluster bacterium PRT-SC02]
MSLILEATIPIIPSCQFRPFNIMTGFSFFIGTSLIISSRSFFSKLFLSVLYKFKSVAILYTSDELIFKSKLAP